ncbi:MAG: S-layer homology domain-containing protein [Clostridiales bacterium]|nr:S-layer homology domain-containing protein [Clostridiales bacterium]
MKSLDSPLRVSIGEPASTIFSSKYTQLSSIPSLSQGAKTFRATFDRVFDGLIKLSLPSDEGDPQLQAVVNEKGLSVGGKYNPAVEQVEAKIYESGDYSVRENKKTFTDISAKVLEMQNAITVLATKGIISGTTETEFSPDASISRAEIAALLTRTLSKLNPNQDGNFTDVLKSDWYFGAIGSAKKHGLMAGTSATVFSPKIVIPKDQIVSVAARVLRLEMKYKDPTDDTSLMAFSDAASLADWSRTDISLATRENLFVLRWDGTFSPNQPMTRGDAAIVLYRLFMKLW